MKSITGQQCLRKLSIGKNAPKVKSFDSIPGPRGLPVIGTLWRYLPFINQYTFTKLHESGLKKYQQYGPIVRENLVGNVHMLYLFDPWDIESAFRQEGNHPMRRSHSALEHYRKQRPQMYNDGGLLPTNGETWWKLRSRLQRPLSKPQSARVYIPVVDDISKEFTQNLAEVRDKNGTIDNFLSHLSRAALEIIGYISLETRLGCISQHTSEDRMIQATIDSLDGVMNTEWVPLWKIYPTSAYRKLEKAQDYLGKVAIDKISDKLKSLKEKEENDSLTLLESYLRDEELDIKDITAMVADMIFAGIDTTSFSMAFILYHLATNPEKQEILYKEIIELLPQASSNMSAKVLSKASYIKAVVKEAMRLNPISIGLGRIARNGTVIRGYNIPEGTVIVTQNQVSCRLKEYFDQPNEFIPERWIRSSPLFQRYHPFLVLPFGYGPRQCIGRRLAEQDIYILLARIIRRFHLEWKEEPLGPKTLLINAPDRPLTFAFKDRL